MCKTLWYIVFYYILFCSILFYSNCYPSDWSQNPLIVTSTLENTILLCISRKDFGTVYRLLPIVYWFYLAGRKDPRALTITLSHLRGCYPKEELVLCCMANVFWFVTRKHLINNEGWSTVTRYISWGSEFISLEMLKLSYGPLGSWVSDGTQALENPFYLNVF